MCPSLFTWCIYYQGRENFCFHVKVTCDVLGFKWFPEETDILCCVVVVVCVYERDWDFAICTKFTFSVLEAYSISIYKAELSWLILGTFKLTIHFRALWDTTLYALRNKTHQSPKMLTPGQASGPSRPVKASTARLNGGDNEIPTPRMAQSQTQLKDWVCPQ